MPGFSGPFNRLRQSVRNLPIVARITIGNALVIIIGAIGGTWVTRHLAAQARDLWLILTFALVGIVLSIIVNYYIVRAALKPLERLRAFVASVQAGESLQSKEISRDGDPSINELARTLEDLVGQLEESNQRLRMISRRAIYAQEEERKRIARSLHDDTAQALSTLIINLEFLERQQPPESESMQKKIMEAHQLAAITLDNLRQTMYGLRPAILDDLGLAPAIRWYARTNLEPSGIQVQLNLPDDQVSLPQELNTTLFRIAQEAINNIRRHSGAKKASITLQQHNGEIYLRVEDDGHGYHAAQDQREAVRLDHWGLVGIQERVDLIGGRLELESEPGTGTLLQVTAPLPGGEGIPNA